MDWRGIIIWSLHLNLLNFIPVAVPENNGWPGQEIRSDAYDECVGKSRLYHTALSESVYVRGECQNSASSQILVNERALNDPHSTPQQGPSFAQRA